MRWKKYIHGKTKTTECKCDICREDIRWISVDNGGYYKSVKCYVNIRVADILDENTMEICHDCYVKHIKPLGDTIHKLLVNWD